MYSSRRPEYRAQNNQPPFKKTGHKTALIAAIAMLAAIFLFVFFYSHHKDAGKPSTNNGQQTTGSFNKEQYPTTEPDSIWVIVNKSNPLNPTKYIPSDLVMPDVPVRVPGNETMQIRSEPSGALKELFTEAKTAGYDLMLASGYRSYGYQQNLYNGYVKDYGQDAADRTSARPGYSEHQTGLSADIEPTNKECELDECFGDMPQGKWLAANAYKYGFIIRYPKDKISLTGYNYEPWHIRYVGKILAAEMHAQGITTLEEFFGVGGGDKFKT